MVYYRDINMDLTMAQDGDIDINEDIDAVENSLTNICSTLQQSRRMLPSFALNAYNLLFEPLTKDTSNLLANAMGDVIEQGDSRVNVKAMNITMDYDNNAYNVTLSYQINNISKDTETFITILQKL